ncbi:MAG TPA: glycosyltransferase family 4 protein [Acidimicrobiales bacterium]
MESHLRDGSAPHRPLKVAMVCPYSLSSPGGVQGQAIGLAEHLRALGHQVILIAPDDGGSVGRVEDRWTVGRSLPLPTNGSVARLAVSPGAALRSVRWLRHEQLDVIHLHEPLAPAVGYGILLRAPSGPPIVGTFHRSGSSRWCRALPTLARWAAGRLSAQVAVSETARATAAEDVGGRFEVLFNGVDLRRFTMAAPTPTTGPTILFVGRHEQRKGLEVLLEAFAGMGDPATLWVVGHGPCTEALQRRYPASERISWLGTLDDEEVAARLAAADVMCAPALGGESFGMVLLEAMASRTAVVASDIAGYRDAAAGRATLVPPGDVASLREALCQAVLDVAHGTGTAAPEALDAGVRRAHELSMERLAGRYVDLYRRVIAAPAGSGGQ